MKGLIVEVLRGQHDCTNGGASSRFNSFTLIDPKIDGPFEPTEDRPAIVLVRRNIGGEEYIHAVPQELVDSKKWVMAGGHFIYSHDSRFRKVASYPIPVHDRVENY